MPTIYDGIVTSIGKMNKTCTVTVTYMREARKILRPVRRTTKFLVHDEDHISRIGDIVKITDGISYTNRKQFRLHTIDRKGQDPTAYTSKAPEWVRMENKAKALIAKTTKAQGLRQDAIDRRAEEREGYTKRMMAAGIGAGRAKAAGAGGVGRVGGSGGAGEGAAKVEVPGLGVLAAAAEGDGKGKGKGGRRGKGGGRWYK